MKQLLECALEKNAHYIEVDALVRYWEDGNINGESDEDGKMPLRFSDAWKPVIDLKTGQVLDWQQDVQADIHYKVCDAGQYWLLDTTKTRIAKWKDYYVPYILSDGKSDFEN